MSWLRFLALILILLGALGYIEQLSGLKWSRRTLGILLGVYLVLSFGQWYADNREQSQTQQSEAQLRQELTTARTELVELKARTALRVLSAEQKAAMLPVVTQLTGRPVAFACRMMDGESCDYATELARFFLEAGCRVPELIKTSANDLPGYLAIAVPGKADAEVAQVLANTFQAAGIPVGLEPIQENSLGVWYADVVHVIVGRKHA
jgi:hypothetical protein